MVQTHVEKAEIVVLGQLENNSVFDTRDLIAFVIYVPNHVFLVKVCHQDMHKKATQKLFLALENVDLYVFFGSLTVKHTKRIVGSFAPKRCVDHGQLAKLVGINYDMNSLAQSVLNEDFCRRTMASPRESFFSSLAKKHIIIRFRLLHHFASQFHRTNTWKKAHEATNEVVLGKASRDRFFKKK